MKQLYELKSAHNFKDITNQKFGYLTAVKPVGIHKTFNKKDGRELSRAVWMFRCDCGKKVTKIRNNVLSNARLNFTNSCGCKAFVDKIGNKHGAWKGFGEISGHYFNAIKKGSQKSTRRKRNLVFDVTIEHLWNLFLKQERKCALSGEILVFGNRKNRTKNCNIEQTASLDRIDSNKGYIKGNVQWVHKYVNSMKQAMDEKVFIEWCRKISRYNV